MLAKEERIKHQGRDERRRSTVKHKLMDRIHEMKQVSPRVKVRITGFVYLMIFLAAPSGAASATPMKMAINLSCDLAVASLLYDLLRPVSRSMSLFAALFRLVFIILMAVTSLNYFGLSSLFQQPRSADAFDAGYGIALVPFGISCVLIGYLVFRSTFLPRVLGVLMGVAGGAYLIFLWPALGNRLFIPWILVPAVVGEASLTLWLIIMGVRADRWQQQDNFQQAAASRRT